MYTLRHVTANVSFHLLDFTYQFLHGPHRCTTDRDFCYMKGRTLVIIHIETGKDSVQYAFTINGMHSGMLRREKNNLILAVSESYHGCLLLNILPFHSHYALVLFHSFLFPIFISQSFYFLKITYCKYKKQGYAR